MDLIVTSDLKCTVSNVHVHVGVYRTAYVFKILKSLSTTYGEKVK